MPALLERLPSPATITESVAQTPSAPTVRTCSGCFLTETMLRETGVLGCPRCYETFAPQVALAAEKLHGVRVPYEWSDTTAAPRRAVTNPWPTRRGTPL